MLFEAGSLWVTLPVDLATVSAVTLRYPWALWNTVKDAIKKEKSGARRNGNAWNLLDSIIPNMLKNIIWTERLQLAFWSLINFQYDDFWSYAWRVSIHSGNSWDLWNVHQLCVAAGEGSWTGSRALLRAVGATKTPGLENRPGLWRLWQINGANFKGRYQVLMFALACRMHRGSQHKLSAIDS